MSEVRVEFAGGTVSIPEPGLDRYRETYAQVEPGRLAFAAAHIVMKESYRDLGHSVDSPGEPETIATHIDWDGTMDLRRFLDKQGFGVAEAMDTAQRFSLGWPLARELIERCGSLDLGNGFMAGAGEDSGNGDEGLVDGVVHQARTIQKAGGWVILLPLPSLCLKGAGEDEYVRVYESIISRLEGPLFIHWLGEMFLPELAGYFPGNSFGKVMALDPGKVRGVKLSLLDADREIRIRRMLMENDQIVLTGDDLHFTDLIMGDNSVQKQIQIGHREVGLGDFSHALLGILDAVAVPAGLALRALGQGHVETYRELMNPLESLSRTVFEAPTCFYKTGLAFLSWLDARQSNRMLINREDLARSDDYLLRVLRDAVSARVIQSPTVAAERLQGVGE